MNVTYSDDVRRDAEIMRLLELATARLQNVITPRYVNDVHAEWDRVPDFGDREQYRLTIADEFGKAYSDFSKTDLENSMLMRVALPQLWGDLVRFRIKFQHANVEALVGS